MSNILNYVLGVLLVCCLLITGAFWVSNNSLEKQVLANQKAITILGVQKDALQANNNDLKKALDTQNASLAKLGEIQATVSSLFTTFNTSVATTNKQIASVKDAISKEKVPTTCADTIQYLKDARKELK